MKLFYSTISPYSRKVRLALHALGLSDRTELSPVTASPVAEDPTYATHNPLAKIPALILDDGLTLFDSRVILDYLCEIGGEALMPPAGARRWAALTGMAAADGVVDAVVLIRCELQMRPPSLVWADWVDGQRRKAVRALDRLDELTRAEASRPLALDITMACALGYLDIRFPASDWRRGRPALAAFFEDFSQTPGMRATHPGEPAPEAHAVGVMLAKDTGAVAQSDGKVGA